MARAKGVKQALNEKYEVFPFEGDWQEAFDQPEIVGTWIIWGNSGNGKSSFAMQLCKELTKYGKVLYNSLEEGDSLTLQQSLQRHNMHEVAGKMHIVCEPMEELKERLKKRKPPRIIVIDSLQYTQMSYRDYVALKNAHRDKLFIFISHAEGKNPSGATARKVKYDASLKIWVEGYKAFSNGRFKGDRGHYVVWEKGAAEYWGFEQEAEPEPLNSVQTVKKQMKKIWKSINS